MEGGFKSEKQGVVSWRLFFGFSLRRYLAVPAYPTEPHHVKSLQSNVLEALNHWARIQPDKIVYRFFLEDGSQDEVTYAQLKQWAMAIASQLHARTRKGARVLLIFPSGLEFIAAFLGCLYARTAAVPVYPPKPHRSSAQLAAIIENCTPSLVLSTSDFCGKSGKAFNRIGPLQGLPWLAAEPFRSRSVSQFDDSAPAESTLALLQYTSGSTGVPKGVAVSHANLTHNLRLIRGAFDASPQTRGVFWLPHYHDMGLIGGILGTLTSGGMSVLLSPVTFIRSPLSWLKAVSQWRATISGGPNFGYELCIAKTTPAQRKRLDLSSWRLAFTGAEPVRWDTLQRFSETFEPAGFRKEAFFSCYGLAESTLMVSGGGATPRAVALDGAALEANGVVEAGSESTAVRTVVSCGRRLPELDIRIVDSRTSVECATDQVGEIWVHGSSVARGYWQRSQATAETFHARLKNGHENGRTYLRTGDLGFLRDDELFVTGRLKDLIIICGRNIYPQDVEWCAQQSHPDLRESVVAAFSVEEGQERLVVAVELQRRHINGDHDVLINAVRQAIGGEHEIDVHAVVLLKPGSIPRTSSGKIRRHACRDAYLGTWMPLANWTADAAPAHIEESGHRPDATMRGAVGRSQSVMTEQDICDWLKARIAMLMSVPEDSIDVQAPFVSFGMSSLQGVRLAEQLEAYLGRGVSPTWVYNYPTITALARRLAQRSPPREFQAQDHSAGEGAASSADTQLLTEVQRLSDDELMAFISQQMAECSDPRGGCN